MKRLIFVFIGVYQRFLSPIMGNGCRFSPTCSCYAHDAVQKYGIIRGGAMAVWRILRCGPWSKGGIDPVP
jgi:putative membrane protein insertion efficiency factor